MTRTRWALSVVASLLLAVAMLGVAGFWRARGEARDFLGPLPSDVVPFRTAAVPLRSAPVTGRLAWVISYGPRAVPGHLGFEVYVAPLGGVVAMNPPDMFARLRTLRGGAQASTPPAP